MAMAQAMSQDPEIAALMQDPAMQQVRKGASGKGTHAACVPKQVAAGASWLAVAAAAAAAAGGATPYVLEAQNHHVQRPTPYMSFCVQIAESKGVISCLQQIFCLSPQACKSNACTAV